MAIHVECAMEMDDGGAARAMVEVMLGVTRVGKVQ